MIKIKFLIFFLLLVCSFNQVFAVHSGKVEYVVPIDYSLINENEVNAEAEKLFNRYMEADSLDEKKKLLDLMLQKYNTLALVNIENPLYFTRLGIIYDKLGNDRYALMNFYRGSNLENNYPYAFQSFGNYFFDRYEYKKALRLYKKAYDCGYNTNYDTLFQIGVIYEKYGDFTNALKFYKDALKLKKTEELENRILLLEELLTKNSLYNQKRGLRN